MPKLNLKSLKATRTETLDSVTVLGTEIPLGRSLPFGARMELTDLQGRFDSGDIGPAVFFLQVFCLFTWRLPKRDRISWEWLQEQDVDAEELRAIIDATNVLLKDLRGDDTPDAAAEAGGGKAKPTARKKAAN